MTRSLLLTLLLALMVFTFVSIWINRGAVPVPGTTETAVENTEAGAAIGGSFRLTDQNGAKVTDESLRGKLLLVFFGFTHCPDICPTTLGTLTEAQTQLGEQSSQVVPVLISVDPARDTPERLKEYLANFHPSVIGLTGSQEEIDQVVKAYRVYAGAPTGMEGEDVAEAEDTDEEEDAQEQGEHHEHGGDYIVPHSGLIYLMGRDGKYIRHFSQEDSAETIAGAVRAHLQ